MPSVKVARRPVRDEQEGKESRFKIIIGKDGCQFGRDFNFSRKMAWTVIDEDAEHVLLISKGVVVLDSFHLEPVDCSWETSYARDFLNGEFLQACFRDTDIRHIRLTVCEDQVNEFGIRPGKRTFDRLFLLSAQEFLRYREVIPSCRVSLEFRARAKEDFFMPEDYQDKLRNRSMELDTDLLFPERDELENFQPLSAVNFFDSIGWWLRTPGVLPSEYMYVSRHNYLHRRGLNAFLAVNGYRPAMWLDRSYFRSLMGGAGR